MSSYPVHYGYSAPEEKIASTGATYGIVCDQVVAINMDASATLYAVQQETVAVTGIHFLFDTALDATNTFKFLNSFTVSGWGPDGTTDGAVVDNLVVQVSDVPAFKEVIKAALLAKQGEIEGALKTDLHEQLRVWLQSDLLINSVQNMFGSIGVALDVSGGADNTGDIFNDVDAAEGLYTQISNDRLKVYADVSEEPITSALPLQGGDKVTFVFDCATELQASYAQTDITGDSTAFTSAVSGSYNAIAPITAGTRRFALTIAMDGTGRLNCASKSEASPNLKA